MSLNWLELPAIGATRRKLLEYICEFYTLGSGEQLICPAGLAGSGWVACSRVSVWLSHSLTSPPWLSDGLWDRRQEDVGFGTARPYLRHRGSSGQNKWQARKMWDGT